MKTSMRLLALASALLMLLCLTACQGEEDSSFNGSIDPNIFLDTEEELDLPAIESEYVQKEFHISTFKGFQHNTGEAGDPFVATLDLYKKSAVAHKEAGFTLMENAIMSRTEGQLAAKACEEVGINFLLQNITGDMGFSGMGASAPAFTEETIATVVDEMKNYKYLEGYYTWDEATMEALLTCRQVNSLFVEKDPKKLTLSIMFPSYGAYRWDDDVPDNSTYAQYVRDFVKTVDPPVLCFDYYPFQVHGGENTDLKTCDMWKDMGLFRTLSIETGKPFWFYFQAYNMSSHTPGHTYTFTNEMRSTQMYAAIAYGAKAVSYFSSIGCAVDSNGNKTAEFDGIKELNRQVKNLGDFLFDKKSEEILHFGLDSVAASQYYLDGVGASYFVKNAPDGTIVSTFSDDSDKHYLLVVNKDHRNAVTGQLKLNDTMKVSHYDHLTDKTGKATNTAAVSLNIPAGGCALYIVE